MVWAQKICQRLFSSTIQTRMNFVEKNIFPKNIVLLTLWAARNPIYRKSTLAGWRFNPRIVANTNCKRGRTQRKPNIYFWHVADDHLGESTAVILTPRFALRQVCAFRPLRSDCVRLRDKRISWIFLKRSASVFRSFTVARTSLKLQVFSQ